MCGAYRRASIGILSQINGERGKSLVQVNLEGHQR